ncbi:MAG: hypothetical protein AAGD25_02260 [Cyanobacteria bacterium P01_F01_bin.150]
MTFQDFFTLLNDYQPLILLWILAAPWIALGICIAVPGQKEEPFVLSLNLGMALISLLLTVGYLLFATHNGGWTRVFQEADILLLMAPCYYVGISLWVTKQRLPLHQVPVVRMVQGAALMATGYLGVAWFLSKIRIHVFSYIPFQYLLLLILGLVAVAYLGYMRLTGEDVKFSNTQTVGRKAMGRRSNPPHSSYRSIEDELDTLRRDLDNNG